ncbi:MAG: hypothetical protein KAX55_01585 [Propionivibrio sp.]|nr:hypothetical protein [Propionivibrio sp.]
MSDEEMEQIMDSGERLPSEMWEPGMPDTIMQSPVFDGEKIVDQGE